MSMIHLFLEKKVTIKIAEHDVARVGRKRIILLVHNSKVITVYIRQKCGTVSAVGFTAWY